MVRPIDYRIDVESPFTAAMQGYGFGQELGQAEQQRQQRIAAQQRQAEMQNDMANFAYSNRKKEDYDMLLAKYPEMSKQIDQIYNNYTEDQKKSQIDQMLPVWSALKTKNYDVAKSQLDELMTAAKNSGDEQTYKEMDLVRQNLELDPTAAEMGIAIPLYRVMGDDFIKMQDTLGTKSRAAQPFQKTGSFLLRDKSTGEMMTGVGVFDPNTGEMKTSTGTIPGNFELVSQEGETPDEAQKRRIAEAAGKTEAQKAASQAADISKQVFNIMQGREAILKAKNIVKDAIKNKKWTGTGPLAQFLPKMNQTSLDLQAVANEMGLAQISQVTLGALSEKELDFVKAASFPEGMKPEDLLTWLENKEKAQNKMARILTDISLRVGRVDQKTNQVYTMADWLRDRRDMFSSPVINENITPGITEAPQQQTAGGNRKAQLFNRLMQIQQSKGQ